MISIIGKVFSTILLERLHKFKKETFPDPPNQLGFTKGAQTYDHILTMQTIASKQWPTDVSAFASVWPRNGNFPLGSASVDKIIPRLGLG